jgi:hypothetical protein
MWDSWRWSQHGSWLAETCLRIALAVLSTDAVAASIKVSASSRASRAGWGTMQQRLHEGAVEDDHGLARELLRVGGCCSTRASEHPAAWPLFVPPDHRVRGMGEISELG